MAHPLHRRVGPTLACCLALATCSDPSGSDPTDAGSLPPLVFDTGGDATGAVGDAGGATSDASAGDAGRPVDAGAVDGASVADAGANTPAKVSRAFGADLVTAELIAEAAGLRTYVLRTSHGLRCGLASKERQFSEPADRPRLRSGNLLFDALYALAVHETAQLSVDAISDGAFNNGKPVDCHCFQTGEKWPWAWTRDTAYAIDLGLATLDPLRARDTVLAKLSALKVGKSGVGPQVVQDTGTGGSWPVSSDRVIWALGARAVWRQLDGPQRDAFATQVKAALQATHAADLAAVFDAASGLYRGEESFLDWREQSYPAWSSARPADIAMSQALSTNIGHLLARQLRRKLSGEAGDESALRKAIADGFYLPQRHLFSALRTTTLDLAPAERFDLLGTALAVLHDIADAATAADVVAHYPVVAAGPPVQWPQQQLVPIYHNRAQWPFVTAYWLQAAARVGNAAVADNALDALIRGAALNLSNMENFEFLSGANHVDDGAYSGPVVNSCRQLWSVAGYLAAVHKVLFGMQVDDDGITFKPFVSRTFRNDWLKGSAEVRLLGLGYRGRSLDVTVTLPKVAPPQWGALGVANHIVNGTSVPQGTVKFGALKAHNSWIAQLADVQAPADEIALVGDDGDYRTFFGPKEPKIVSLAITGQVLGLTLDAQGEKEVVFDVFRDGQQVAWGLTSPAWADPKSGDYNKQSWCYSVAARYLVSNTASHHSAPACWWGSKGERISDMGAWRLGGLWGAGASWSGANELPHVANWGAPAGELKVAAWVPKHTGKHLFQVRYANTNGPINSGITAAHKRLEVATADGGKVLFSGPAVMPQLGLQHRWGDSTLVGPVALTAGKPVRIRLSEPEKLGNMADLSAMSLYTGGKGGGDNPHNRADVAGIRALALDGELQTPKSGALATFDGVDDVQKLAPAQQLVPGIPLAPWARLALDWDDDWLYLVVVGKGFEDDLKAMMIYLQATDGLQTAQPAPGLPYLGLSAMLPFQASHVIGLRSKTNVGDGAGPWAGVYERGSGDWRLQTRFQPGVAMWLAADKHTVALRLHRAELAGLKAKKLRLAGHLVHGGAGNEYKAVVPAGHTPWKASATGYYEIDLNGSHPVKGWLEK